MRRLPIRIDEPCAERWSDMRQVAGGRHCDRCEKTVVDLTRATRREAEDVVRAHAGHVCVRLSGDSRGEPVFRAEPRRLPVLPLALAGLLAACAPDDEAPVADPVAEVPDPDAEAGDADSGLMMPMGAGFGGSLATGMPMPDPPPPSAEPPPVVLEPGTDGTPTPDQIARTQRKRRRQQPPVSVPTGPRHMMGAVACPID